VWGDPKTASTGGPIDVGIPPGGVAASSGGVAASAGRVATASGGVATEPERLEDAENGVKDVKATQGGVLGRTSEGQNSLHARMQLLAAPIGSSPGFKRGKGVVEATPSGVPEPAAQSGRPGNKRAMEASPSSVATAGTGEPPAFIQVQTICCEYDTVSILRFLL
jgi:hypothetical protein